jgi:multicomponent Na+:H+ antiporter subunit D
MSNFWLHPAVILLLGAALLPLVPRRFKLPYLILVPACSLRARSG